MSKRNISNKQKKRIKDKQNQYLLQNTNLPTTDGLVLARYSKDALIESIEGNILNCTIRPTLDSIVTGDRVVWQKEGQHGVIISAYPRSSTLGRPDRRGKIKSIAANITQLIIVIAAKPMVSWPLLDSYLILAEYLHLKAVILLNKIDLPSESLRQVLAKDYSPLNYDIIYLSKQDSQTFKALEKKLNLETSILVGQSGVGKSSIISKLLPDESTIDTAPVSLHSGLGQHTTSTTRLFHLKTGGDLIDSPGVREFSLWNISIQDIMKGYKEFRPYLDKCKFRNCNHIQDPHCSIIQAVQAQQISRLRYESYVKLASKN